MGWVFYEDKLAAPWDSLVENHEQGRFVHLIGFKRAVEKNYHLKPVYLAYLEKNDVLGLFPGFFHQSFLFGRKIISQPFSEYGGLLLRPDLSAEKKSVIRATFLEFMRKKMKEAGWPFLEMHHPPDAWALTAEGFEARKLFRRSWMELEDPRLLWEKLDPKERNILRRAQAYQLKMGIIDDVQDIKKKFYLLYLKTMKRLGSPPHPVSFFIDLFQLLSSHLKIFIFHLKSIPVSALVAWCVGRTVHITEMVSDEKYFLVKPNDWAIWQFLSWAWNEGYHIFDFGPVRYRGQEIFKKKWLMRLENYYYVYVSAEAGEAKKIKNVFSGESFLLRLAPLVWKNSLPLPLTAAIGKYFRRQLGM